MARERTIQCEVCKSDHHTRAKNTKYCNVCRLDRDLTFIGTKRKYKCLRCETPFMPINRTDELCGHCDYGRRHDGWGSCGFCKAENVPLIRPDISVCKACAKDPEKRGALIGAVYRKVQERTKDPVKLGLTEYEIFQAECDAIPEDQVPKI